MGEANDAIDEIVYDAEITIPDASDVMNANELQNETLLYPMDAIIASLADGVAESAALVCQPEIVDFW